MKRIILALGLVLASCATHPPEDSTPPLTATPLAFEDLSGWKTDPVSEVLPVFVRSCERMTREPSRGVDFLPGIDGSGYLDVSEIAGLCTQAAMLPARVQSEDEVRQFFERNFVPVLVSREMPADALFTGYFEPTYPGAMSPAEGLVPVLSKPDDLVSVDLGAFDPDLSGKQILGRIEGQRLIPYKTNEEIIATPPATSETIAYMDPTDLLFLQIQGSGRLVFSDGSVQRIGYAGKNGRKYVPVGRTLVQDGALPLEKISMQSIRRWLVTAPPAEAARVRHSNPSYVFFTKLDGLKNENLGPLGAQGAQLSDMRSIAVDDDVYGYGLPVWVERNGDQPSTRLFVAQDTGGAIRGAQRGDLYIGSGEAAGQIAGKLKDRGRMVILLPKSALNEKTDAP